MIWAISPNPTTPTFIFVMVNTPFLSKARFNVNEWYLTVGTVPPCHPERSEGSATIGSQMLRCADPSLRSGRQGWTFLLLRNCPVHAEPCLRFKTRQNPESTNYPYWAKINH